MKGEGMSKQTLREVIDECTTPDDWRYCPHCDRNVPYDVMCGLLCEHGLMQNMKYGKPIPKVCHGTKARPNKDRRY